MPSRPRIPGILALTLAASFSGAQTQEVSPWRRALDRYEHRLDDLLDDLTWSETQHKSLVGIFVPAVPTPDAAAALPDAWIPLTGAPPQRLVLLVHGLDEPGDIWCDLAPELMRSGFSVARFEYPNDQRVHTSAEELLEHLRSARAAGVDEISIVAHSMGGLVTLDALTRDDGYAGAPGAPGLPRVRRVIAVGTPWEGSPLARLRAAAEIREQVQRWLMSKSWDVRPILDYRRDGMGEAGADLEPGSPLLTELHQRPWPEGLPLTIIAGQIAAAQEIDLAWVRDSKLLRQLLDDDQIDALSKDLAEAASILGDGAVPIDSALARRSPDTSIFGVNHRALIRRSPIDFVTGSEAGGPPGIPVILERLGADRDSAGAP
ncbi:MAG: alpha/beta fold hydrolase [Phycisphaerales bacterium]|nr:alpha/beta fold hydrolase [Phycisphaerales bacterium]